jgi:Putative metal-binding motif/Secretion system C-terminal sorting domain
MFSKKALLFCLLLLSLTGSAQQFTLTLANQSSTSTTFSFDLMLTVPAGGRRVHSVSAGINFNAAILNGGTPATTAGTSFLLVPGTIAPELQANGGLNTMTTTYRGPGTPQLRIVQVTKATSLVDLVAGTYRCGTFTFTNTTTWTPSSNAQLWISPTAAIPSAGGTNAIVGNQVFGSAVAPVSQTTTTTPALILTHTSASTYSVPLNSCPTAATASSLVAESPCAGAANGSALITLTGAPNASSPVTYTVDGGATQNATLSSGAFTVSGLAAGAHIVSVTYPTCTAVSTSSFTIGAGTPLTTTGSESQSVCGTSYTWPTSGATYTSSGTYTHVVGCNTATLTLTLTPNTTTGSESVTACGTSYVWATSGLTYTASGVYPFVSGCNTATLTLTLNTSAQTFYADTDGDGFGAGAAIFSCTGQPANTSTNNTDCAPNDATKWRTANFFVDADNDGYNNGFPATSQCYGATTPSGFVAVNNGVDCNDNNASVNPNASEVLGNGIDDNCDGTTDEVTPLSSLTVQSCNSTLTYINGGIFAYPLTSFPELGTVQGYRFRVTNGASVRTYDSPTNGFNLLNLPGGATYATVYTVEVSVKTGGYFRAYGPTCTVTTPAVPNSAYIANPACGTTLTDINQSIFCNQVTTASGYRFRVRNGATLVGTVNTTVNRFSLTALGISNIAFGTTYTVDVLLAFGGVYRPDAEYGDACSITTPATPGTSRVIQPSCGSTINALWTTIYAQQVVGAQGYKFVVTNGAQTREYATANSRFQLPLLAGGAVANTAYTIRVDVLYNLSYVQGTVLCTITTSPTATRQTSTALDIYEVKAYPNPYADTFKLDVNTSSEDQVGVRVYDMLGREVEARQASVANITNLEIGSQYPSGVYNIIVTQGNNVKTLRVIKR